MTIAVDLGRKATKQTNKPTKSEVYSFGLVHLSGTPFNAFFIYMISITNLIKGGYPGSFI